MKIARLKLNNSIETYGIVSEDGKRLIIKEQMQEKTGIPIPPNIKEFLFGGWLEEINNKKKMNWNTIYQLMMLNFYLPFQILQR